MCLCLSLFVCRSAVYGSTEAGVRVTQSRAAALTRHEADPLPWRCRVFLERMRPVATCLQLSVLRRTQNPSPVCLPLFYGDNLPTKRVEGRKNSFTEVSALCSERPSFKSALSDECPVPIR